MDSVTIGVDLGDRHSRICVVDGEAKVVEEGRVRTSPEGLRRRFGSEPRARVILEVGTHSPWASRLLQELGHEVIVANPRRLKFIHGETNKSDRSDAEQLARVGRMDPTLLRPIEHRGAQAQGDLAVLRSRDAMVRARAPLVTHVRGSVKAMGARLPACSHAEVATPRSVPRWPWPGSWRSCCTTCGCQGRTMSRGTTCPRITTLPMSPPS